MMQSIRFLVRSRRNEKGFMSITFAVMLVAIVGGGVLALPIALAQFGLTPADRAEKFLDCAGRVLGSANAKKLLDLTERCGQLKSVVELTRATVPNETRQPAHA